MDSTIGVCTSFFSTGGLLKGGGGGVMGGGDVGIYNI